MWFSNVYKGWRDASQRFVYRRGLSAFETLSSKFGPGKRMHLCGDIQVAECKAYCCSGGDGIIELSPFEIAVISNKKTVAPKDFVDYGELNYRMILDGKSPVEILPLFAIRMNKETGRCVFNQPDYRCGIYEFRPLTCRVYPYTEQGNVVRQRKACAGYACGSRASQAEFEVISKLTKMIRANSAIFFSGINREDWELGRNSKVLEEMLERLGLPYSEHVSSIDIASLYAKTAQNSDIISKIKSAKTDNKEFLEFLVKEMAVPKEPAFSVPKPDIIESSRAFAIPGLAVEAAPTIAMESLQVQPAPQLTLIPESGISSKLNSNMERDVR